jgi:hypothetical protein
MIQMIADVPPDGPRRHEVDYCFRGDLNLVDVALKNRNHAVGGGEEVAEDGTEVVASSK